MSGLRVFRLATVDFILSTILALLRSKGVFPLKFRKLGCTGRADEDHSEVGLDSGTIYITGLVKHLCMRLATSAHDI